jgi:DNA primase
MDAVEEIKSRLSIEDVVGEYVVLKRSGRNFKGLSPWSNERTPSFVVSPEKQIWHDFSTGKGGSMFSFVMEMEGLEFRGALEHLARKAGIDIEQFKSQKSDDGAKKNQLIEVVELATKFYQAQLKANPEAARYLLQKRAYSLETIAAFRLGYSPDSGTALVDFLIKKGVLSADIRAAGLCSKNTSLYDMFRGRIMVPLMDSHGSPIGFTARLLHDDPEAPKYINTPQTMLYDKSRHVFGLHLAKESIRKSKYVVIAEGNLDVIGSWQAGVRQVVATAGTALTSYQLKILQRFTGDLRLAYDADGAGQNAAERSIAVAQSSGASLSMINLPGGKDPDELCKLDPKAWEAAVAKPQYAVDWLLDRYQKIYDIATVPGKKALHQAVSMVIRQLSDPVEKDHYLKKMAKILGVSEQAVSLDVSDEPGPKTLRRNKGLDQGQVDKSTQAYGKLIDITLSLALSAPKLRTHLANIPTILWDEDTAKLVGVLIANPNERDLAKLAEVLHFWPDRVKILTLLFEELFEGLSAEDREEEFAKLSARLVETFVKNQKATLITQLQNAETEGTAQTDILIQINELDKLLK